jgi:hypothetical protein
MLLVLIFFIIGLQLFFLKTPAETQPLNLSAFRKYARNFSRRNFSRRDPVRSRRESFRSPAKRRNVA